MPDYYWSIWWPVIVRDTFLALAPVLGPQQKTASSTGHGGEHDTKRVTFELLLRAAFVADEKLGFMLEPARMYE